MTFDTLGLAAPLVRAVADAGYSTPTPIQLKAIPHVLAGRDVLGCAQTGTGKTAAFALPILHLLSGAAGPSKVRCLVVTPTRELALQIEESFRDYGRHTRLRHAVIFGGVGQDKQVAALRRGVDILVATPGRLLDLMSQRLVSLGEVSILVLDEADRMLDMGFIHDVKRIIAAVPKQRQTLFFSATMPQEIRALVNSILTDPVRVDVAPVTATADKVSQRVFHVDKGNKRALLVHVLSSPEVSRAIVFARTKSGANRVAKHLVAERIAAEVIHGNKSQNARERALGAFKSGQTRVLVATDIAARGIDVDEISHVVNFELPNVPETYVHRIGRTARAGASGMALSFCDHEERPFLRDIERTIRQQIPVEDGHPFPQGRTPVAEAASEERRPRGGGQRGGARPGGAGRTGPRSRQGGGGGRGPRPAQASARGGEGQKTSAPSRPARPTMPRWS
jgi:ATP-dependent RNA helicase RhlE